MYARYTHTCPFTLACTCTVTTHTKVNEYTCMHVYMYIYIYVSLHPSTPSSHQQACWPSGVWRLSEPGPCWPPRTGCAPGRPWACAWAFKGMPGLCLGAQSRGSSKPWPTSASSWPCSCHRMPKYRRQQNSTVRTLDSGAQGSKLFRQRSSSAAAVTLCGRLFLDLHACCH